MAAPARETINQLGPRTRPDGSFAGVRRPQKPKEKKRRHSRALCPSKSLVPSVNRKRMRCHFSEAPENPAKSSLTATTAPGRDMAALVLGGLLGPTALASAMHLQEPLRSQEKMQVKLFSPPDLAGSCLRLLQQVGTSHPLPAAATCSVCSEPLSVALKRLLRWFCCRGSCIHRALWQGGCSEQTALMGHGSSQSAWMAANSTNPGPRSWLTAAGGTGQSASWDSPPAAAPPAAQAARGGQQLLCGHWGFLPSPRAAAASAAPRHHVCCGF